MATSDTRAHLIVADFRDYFIFFTLVQFIRSTWGDLDKNVKKQLLVVGGYSPPSLRTHRGAGKQTHVTPGREGEYFAARELARTALLDIRVPIAG